MFKIYIYNKTKPFGFNTEPFICGYLGDQNAEFKWDYKISDWIKYYV